MRRVAPAPGTTGPACTGEPRQAAQEPTLFGSGGPACGRQLAPDQLPCFQRFQFNHMNRTQNVACPVQAANPPQRPSVAAAAAKITDSTTRAPAPHARLLTCSPALLSAAHQTVAYRVSHWMPLNLAVAAGPSRPRSARGRRPRRRQLPRGPLNPLVDRQFPGLERTLPTPTRRAPKLGVTR